MINKERLTSEFMELVAIDSIPFEERQMADRLKKKLMELGFEVEEDSTAAVYHGSCGNVYGLLKGQLQGEPLLFSAHMDTVEPGKNKKAVLHEDGTITSDGTTVLGADDLSGVVAILEAVRTIQEQKIPHRDIEVLFTYAEEVYIRGSEVFDFHKLQAKEAYTLDLDGEIGTAAIQAPTLVSLTAEFKGKASHAGFAPEQGIHAIAVAAEAITKISQGRIDAKTTVNIGTITGGKARNIVPERCTLQGEVRSQEHSKAVAEAAKIKEQFEQTAGRYGAELEFTTTFGCIAYEIPKEHRVIQRFERCCKALGYPVKLISTFGGSDNNNFVRNGISGIVLACGMHQVHSLKEFTHVDELEQCCNIVIRLMTCAD